MENELKRNYINNIYDCIVSAHPGAKRSMDLSDHIDEVSAVARVCDAAKPFLTRLQDEYVRQNGVQYTPTPYASQEDVLDKTELAVVNKNIELIISGLDALDSPVGTTGQLRESVYGLRPEEHKGYRALDFALKRMTPELINRFTSLQVI